MKSLHVLFSLIGYVSVAYGQGLAIDASANMPISASQFMCLSNQFDIFIGQIYTADGQLNQMGIQNIMNAQQADLWIDAFVTPCRNANMTCKNGLISGADQANAIIQALHLDNEEHFLFLQIKKGNWPNDVQGNRQFILDFTGTIKAASGIGILTSYNDWSSIVGGSWTGANDMDLWWVNWNGKQDLTTGYTPFGGWSAPCFHQFAGNVMSNTCTNGTAINYNYYEQCTCQDDVCYDRFHKKRVMKRQLKQNRLAKLTRHGLQ